MDDEKVKEGKRLIFPGFAVNFPAPGNQPEIEIKRKRGRERKKDTKRDQSSDGAKVF